MEDERQYLTFLLESVQARLAALGGLGSTTGSESAGAGVGEEAPKAVRAYDDYLRCVFLAQPRSAHRFYASMHVHHHHTTHKIGRDLFSRFLLTPHSHAYHHHHHNTHTK